MVGAFLVPWLSPWLAPNSLAALVAREVDSTPVGPLDPGRTNDAVEAALARIYVHIASGNTQAALQQTDMLLQQYPNFRLAHLIRGDLLLSRTRPINGLGAAPDAPAERVDALRGEAQKRLEALRQRPPQGFVPSYALKLRPDQKHLIIADMSRSRLYLFEHQQGQLKLLDDKYISQGKQGYGKEREGDQRTPIGVYQTTSLIPDNKLDDFYGAGALPINYPNDYDKRLGRTGHGIWLHGVPSDTYSRTPLASDGCVVLSNPHMARLMKTVAPQGTPVLISKKIEWVSPQQLAVERQSLERALETWRTDWENRVHTQYAAHYDSRFQGDNLNRDAWLARKQQVNAAKTWIKIQLDQVSMFLYPGAEQMAVVEFQQNYSSSNLNSQSKKRMYWVKRNGEWKILIEASA